MHGDAVEEILQAPNRDARGGSRHCSKEVPRINSGSCAPRCTATSIGSRSRSARSTAPSACQAACRASSVASMISSSQDMRGLDRVVPDVEAGG
jgi:hypothetical protein